MEFDLVRVDQEPERLAGPVLLPLGDDLQVVEAEARAVEPWPGDREQVAALDRVALAVVDRRREPVLARCRRLDRLAGLAVGVERDVPALDGRLDRPALGVVGDLEQLERPLAGDRLAVERLGAEPRLDRVARAVVAAIDPGVDGERLAGDQHGPRPDDRPARLVGDLGRDLVAMVLVGMSRLGRSRCRSRRGASRRAGSAARPRPRPREAPAGCPHHAGQRAGACPSATSRDTTTNRRRTTSSPGRTASPSGRPDTSARRPSCG